MKKCFLCPKEVVLTHICDECEKKIKILDLFSGEGGVSQ